MKKNIFSTMALMVVFIRSKLVLDLGLFIGTGGLFPKKEVVFVD